MMWLSFCDPDRPKGTQFLGAALVDADDIAEASRMAWALGCNPGGEVLGHIIPMDRVDLIDPKWMHRLLTREECVAINNAMLRLLESKGIDP